MLPCNKGLERTKKIKQKLWVTKGIQTSIKRSDTLYKETITEKDSQKKIQKHEAYRKYQNKIVDSLKVSKQTHYKKYFEGNRKNCKVLWDCIHQIIYSKKKKDNTSPSPLLMNEQIFTDKLNIAGNFKKAGNRLERSYKIRYIQRTETTHTISKVLTQVPSLHHQPHLRK